MICCPRICATCFASSIDDDDDDDDEDDDDDDDDDDDLQLPSHFAESAAAAGVQQATALTGFLFRTG